MIFNFFEKKQFVMFIPEKIQNTFKIATDKTYEMDTIDIFSIEDFEVVDHLLPEVHSSNDIMFQSCSRALETGSTSMSIFC